MKKAVIIIFSFFILPLAILGQQSGDPFKQAESYYFEKKYEAALDALLNVIASEPNHPQASSYIGDIYLIMHEYEKALQYYNIAKEVSPEKGKEYFRIGQVYMAIKKPDLAIESFQKAYSLSPGFKPSLYQLGHIYLMDKRDKQNTITYWRRFLQEAPTDYQYEKIKKILAILEDPDFEIPPESSGISVIDALNDRAIKAGDVTLEDTSAGSANDRTNNTTEELLDNVDDGI